MKLVDPVKIYAADTNIQAQLMCRFLQARDIDAFASEDLSPAGIWMGGTIPGVFDAGVYVSRADADRAHDVIRAWELQNADRFAATSIDISATCEECGATSAFPSNQRGTVQRCPQCFATMDIGDIESSDDDWGTEEEADEPTST